MIFNSFSFIVFFISVVFLFFSFSGRKRLLILLLANYFFYGFSEIRYLCLLLLLTVLTYFAAIFIEKYPFHKRMIVGLCIGIGLSVLFVYKYLNLGISLFNDYILNSKEPSSFLKIVLPIGISFYIFQAIGYVIDVYRNKTNTEKDFLIYASFVSFFPIILSGPIERAPHLLPQLKNNSTCFSAFNAESGCRLILWGIFKKIVISNRLAVYVNMVFNNVDRFGALEYIGATFLFTIQIYCDFSGYSDIAIGCAKIMGYDLIRNFNLPYFSKSIGEFWHRWHISLSTWFRDYFYISLGGNRVSAPRHYLNLFLTFLLSGLWHGANLTFLIWGAIHGVLIMLENFVSKNVKVNFKIPDTIKIIFVFILVSYAWMFFRANNISDAIHITSVIFSNCKVYFDSYAWTKFLAGINFVTFNNTVSHIYINTLVGVSLLILFFVEYFQFRKKLISLDQITCPILKYAIYSILLLIVLFVGLFDNTQFIYFQF